MMPFTEKNESRMKLVMLLMGFTQDQFFPVEPIRVDQSEYFDLWLALLDKYMISLWPSFGLYDIVGCMPNSRKSSILNRSIIKSKFCCERQ